MSTKNTIFYRGRTAVSVDFSANEISSDGAVVLLEKLEKQHGLLGYFSTFISDKRNPSLIRHSMSKLLKQSVFLLMQGYEDTNDVTHLQNDPLLKDVLGDLWHPSLPCPGLKIVLTNRLSSDFVMPK